MTKITWFIAALLIAAATLFAGAATAAPITQSLGQVLDDFYGASTPAGAYGISDTGDESFFPVDSDGTADDSDFAMLFELAGFKSLNTFGLYVSDATDTVVRSLEIFNGSAAGQDSTLFPSQSTVEWDFIADTATNQSTSLSIDVSEILDGVLGWSLGFYLTTPNETFYTDDSLNSDGKRHAGVFDTSDFAPINGDRVLAWEDLPQSSWGTGEPDYNDMVIGITDISSGESGITSVPEPPPLALLSCGLIGLGLWKRRQEKTQ